MKLKDLVNLYEGQDIQALALNTNAFKNVGFEERKSVLQQIQSRQKLKQKSPHWYKERSHLILPEPAVIEQASSEATALFKRDIIQRFSDSSDRAFLDLSAGAGIDLWAITKDFDRITCIEKDHNTASCLANNLAHFYPEKTDIICADAEEFFANSEEQSHSWIYIDPARRNNQQKGRYLLEDGTPSIFAILNSIGSTYKPKILLKTSPLLDIQKTLKELPFIQRVFCVGYEDQCKEVLYLIDFSMPQMDWAAIPIESVIIDHSGQAMKSLVFTFKDEQGSQPDYSEALKYIYVPHPAMMKSGAFQNIALFFGLNKVAANTHLYTSNHMQPDFPGRIFEVIDTFPYSSKSMPVNNADILCRNFPHQPEYIKKKYKIKDGGKHTIIGFEDMNGKKSYAFCMKIKKDSLLLS